MPNDLPCCPNSMIMKTKLFLGIIFSFSALLASAQPFTPDTSFGTNGKASCEFGNETNFLRRIALQPDGKIVACGYYEYNRFTIWQRTSELAVARFNPDGSLDEAFGASGKVLVPFLANADFRPTAIQLLPDGKMLLLCYKAYLIQQYIHHAVLMKLNADGSPDSTFGTNGILDVDPTAAYSLCTALEVQTDGKILIGGQTGNLVNPMNFAVYRFNADGTRDQSFGTSGLFTANLGSNGSVLPESYDEIDVFKIMPDGSIFAAGDTAYREEGAMDYSGKFVIYKLNSNGTVVSDFGDNGRTSANYPQYRAHILRSIEVSPDQKITITGICTNYNDAYSGIATVRYNADGSFDNSYGTGGKAYFDNGFEFPKFAVFNSILKSDGKLLILGAGRDEDTEPIRDYYITKSILLQLNADGSVDNSFSPDGLYWAALNDINGEATTWDFATQPDGKIVLAGWCRGTDGRKKMGLWRFASTALATETFASNDFSVVPNPFTDRVFLNFNLNGSSLLSADLFDSNGRKIQNLIQDKIFSSGSNAIEVQMPESLAKGVYLIKVYNGSTNTTLKIIK